MRKIAFSILVLSVFGFASGLNAAQEYLLAKRIGVMSEDGNPKVTLFNNKDADKGVVAIVGSNNEDLTLTSDMIFMSDTNKVTRLVLAVTEEKGAMIIFFDKNGKKVKVIGEK